MLQRLLPTVAQCLNKTCHSTWKQQNAVPHFQTEHTRGKLLLKNILTNILTSPCRRSGIFNKENALKKVEIIQTHVVFHLNIGHIVQLQSIYSVISVQQLVYNRSCTIIRAIPGGHVIWKASTLWSVYKRLENYCWIHSLFTDLKYTFFMLYFQVETNCGHTV